METTCGSDALVDGPGSGPVELGGADAHVGAYLFAHTAGDNTSIQRLHLGPYSCAVAMQTCHAR
jgi:hypothetical protein